MNALKGTLVKVGGFQHLDCCCCVAKRAHGVIGIDAQITVDRSLDRELGVGEARAYGAAQSQVDQSLMIRSFGSKIESRPAGDLRLARALWSGQPTQTPIDPCS